MPCLQTSIRLVLTVCHTVLFWPTDGINWGVNKYLLLSSTLQKHICTQINCYLNTWKFHNNICLYSIWSYESGTGKVLYQCWLRHLPSDMYWSFKHSNALFVLTSYQRILDWCSSKFGIVIQYIFVLSLSKCPRRLKTFLWHDISNNYVN